MFPSLGGIFALYCDTFPYHPPSPYLEIFSVVGQPKSSAIAIVTPNSTSVVVASK
jgi:hypothetical protein